MGASLVHFSGLVASNVFTTTVISQTPALKHDWGQWKSKEKRRG